MKPLIVTHCLIIVVAGLGGLASLGFAPAPNRGVGHVPKEWYLLPEKGGIFTPAEKIFSPNQALEVSTDALFREDAHILQGALGSAAGPLPGTSLLPGLPKDLKPWSLDVVMTDFALTTDGLLGHLLLDGTAAVETVWLRKPLQAPPSSGGQIQLTSLSSAADLKKQMETAITAALATGRIRGESRFRDELTRIIEEFAALTHEFQMAPSQPAWPLKEFRLEVGFDVSGAVAPILSPGLAVTLRFDWHKIEGREVSRPIRRGIIPGILGKGIRDFVRTLSREMQRTSSEELEIRKYGFEPFELKLEVGLTAGGNIGIASASAASSGILVFVKPEAPVPLVPAVPQAVPQFLDSSSDRDDESLHPIYLISDSSDKDVLQYAAQTGTSFSQAKDLNFPDLQRLLFKLTAQSIRSGLRKAMKMSSLFARHASRHSFGEFRAKELNIKFQPSVTGDFGIVTVGAFGAIELSFENSKF